MRNIMIFFLPHHSLSLAKTQNKCSGVKQGESDSWQTETLTSILMKVPTGEWDLRAHCSRSALLLMWMLSILICPLVGCSKNPSNTTYTRESDIQVITAQLMCLLLNSGIHKHANTQWLSTWYSLGLRGRMVRPSFQWLPWSPFNAHNRVSPWSLSLSRTLRLPCASPWSW